MGKGELTSWLAQHYHMVLQSQHMPWFKLKEDKTNLLPLASILEGEYFFLFSLLSIQINLRNNLVNTDSNSKCSNNYLQIPRT